MKITRSTIQKRSKINILASINHYEKMEGKLINQEEHLKAMKEDFEKGNYGTWYSGYDEGKFIENDNLIFVLIDQDVASAGEGFVDRLRYIENVVFIGGNTRGCYLVPNNYTYQLPNSKLDLGFGEGVFIGAEGENLDAEGFKPDIWIDSADALNATVKLIKNYKLD